MTVHPQRRVQKGTGLVERWCPYCRAVAPQATPHVDWAAAHGPCQEAAEQLTAEELFHTYITTKEK